MQTILYQYESYLNFLLLMKAIMSSTENSVAISHFGHTIFLIHVFMIKVLRPTYIEANSWLTLSKGLVTESNKNRTRQNITD